MTINERASDLIHSEIADFFAGFGNPGEPDIQSGEAQRQLMARIDTVLQQYRAAAEPVCPKCGGTGMADSGGFQPWGEPIFIECDCHAAPQVTSVPQLAVWYGSMPESNGKTNWTAILHRKGEGILDGFAIDRSEYPGRVLYAADRVRYLIGEMAERPYILNYDADEHSGYTAAPAVQAEQLSGNTEQVSQPALPATHFKPVADLYALKTLSGQIYSYTASPHEAKMWLGVDGYSVQEFVKLERLQEAITGNSPAIPDGYALVPVEPTSAILDEFDSIIDYGAEDPNDAWCRLLASAWVKSPPAAPKQEAE